MGRNPSWQKKKLEKIQRVPSVDLWLPWHTPEGAPPFICEDTRIKMYGKSLQGDGECWSHDTITVWVRYGRRPLDKQRNEVASQAAGKASKARWQAPTGSRVDRVSQTERGGLDPLHRGAPDAHTAEEGEMSILPDPRRDVDVAEVLGGLR